MNLYILNLDLDEVAVFDTYNSLIWTDRYYEYGDFEIYTGMEQTLLDVIKQDYYIRREDSEHVMIIESIKITSDVEEGDLITVTGRSLESILDRRIIWGQKSISGNLQTAIKTLINECIISPSNTSRKIDNFTFKDSTDTAITDLTIEAQYTGDNLYEVIQKICEERGIGFKVTLNESKQFVFELYAGVDRSYDQLENAYVIFSPSYDNLISANYLESKQSWKNVTLVGGEGEGSERKYTGVGNTKGLFRREIFTDARDISSNLDDGETISDTEYTALLRQRGKEALAENLDIVSFEGEAETTILFRYGEDFFDGDIVQVADAYGHEVRARILEIVTSYNEEGFSMYPTFSTLSISNALPDGYLELNYIESSGTQYIDTGFKPNHNTRLIMDVDILSTNPSSSVCIFGSRDSRYFILWALTANTFRTDYGTEVLVIDQIPRGRYLLDKNKNITYINDVAYSITSEPFQTTCNLGLFALIESEGIDERMVHMRLYSCKIYDNDFLIRDFIPCKNDQDVIGLYDAVEGVFYANSGTGSFKTGTEEDELPNGYTRLNCIESSGTQHIDTGFKPKSTTRIVMSFSSSVLYDAPACVYGSRNGSSNDVFGLWLDKEKAVQPQYGDTFYNTQTVENIDYTQKLTYEQNENVFRLNSSTRTFGTVSFTSNYNLTLFAMNSAGLIDKRRVSGKLYSCQIYDNGVLVRNFIPCKNTQNVVGLYDTVNNAFYTNSGTGAFVAG